MVGSGGGAAASAAAGRDARTDPPPTQEETGASSASSRRSPRASETPPLRPSIAQLIREMRAAFGARFLLFELEAKRAAWSAAYMLAFGVGAALLGVTAWLILIAGLVYGAVVAGVPWLVAGIVAIALHAVAVFFLVRAIRAMVDNLTFAATRRTLAESSTAHNDSSA
ncbi:MAG: phage holin family protein [Burkholderiaceae bacterium]